VPPELVFESFCAAPTHFDLAAYETGKGSKADATLVGEVAALAEQFGKELADSGSGRQLRREDLKLICFEYVTG